MNLFRKSAETKRKSAEAASLDAPSPPPYLSRIPSPGPNPSLSRGPSPSPNRELSRGPSPSPFHDVKRGPSPSLQDMKRGPSPTPAFRSKFASLSLHMMDRLRLMQFPPDIVVLVQNTISQHWHLGIQATRDYAGSYEFKLKGKPWVGYGEDAVHARRLMRALLATLFNAGWVLALSTDISKKTSDKDTLMFRYQEAPALCEWTTIAFSRWDRLRLIDTPPELVSAIGTMLGNMVQKQKEHMPGVWEYQLLGHPWVATGEETMTSRQILLRLMELLEMHGFTVYASIDQKYGSEDSSETDTWTCCRPVGWKEGAPVYHA